jgi:hypothetical protein
MPSVSPAPSPPLPRALLVPSVGATVGVGILRPTLGPFFPKAGPVGILVIALAYFSVGVAVGALMKHTPRARPWLPWLVVPGIVAAIAFVVWVIRSLM